MQTMYSEGNIHLTHISLMFDSYNVKVILYVYFTKFQVTY